MKRLKTFESYVDSAEESGLYVQMSSLLDRAREIYFEITGEEQSIDNPEEAISYLSEFNDMEDVQDLLDSIEELNNQIDEIESESYFSEIDEDEE